MQERFAELRHTWCQHEYDLNLGIGLARGFATLVAIAFDDEDAMRAEDLRELVLKSIAQPVHGYGIAGLRNVGIMLPWHRQNLVTISFESHLPRMTLLY